MNQTVISLHVAKTLIMDDILEERDRQDAKRGVQNHLPIEWIAVLTEEVGEASQEALRIHFGGKSKDDYRHELVQVAAVAMAMIECLDRNH